MTEFLAQLEATEPELAEELAGIRDLDDLVAGAGAAMLVLGSALVAGARRSS